MISKATIKGQVVIPSELRKKYNIKKGSRVSIYEGEGNIIIIKPLPDDPITASKGMLKGKTSIIKALTRDREEEAKRG
jgi:AbrB family looped-hinge helix DNA binding protein